MKAPFKLPWLPIAAVSGAAVLVLAIVFRGNLQASTWKEIAGGTLIGLVWAALSERKAFAQHIRNAWQRWRRARPWGWETVRDTRITRYQVHSSGRRRAVTRPAFGYQPVDRKWVKTGEWSTWEDRMPLPSKSGITSRADVVKRITTQRADGSYRQRIDDVGATYIDRTPKSVRDNSIARCQVVSGFVVHDDHAHDIQPDGSLGPATAEVQAFKP